MDDHRAYTPATTGGTTCPTLGTMYSEAAHHLEMMAEIIRGMCECHHMVSVCKPHPKHKMGPGSTSHDSEGMSTEMSSTTNPMLTRMATQHWASYQRTLSMIAKQDQDLAQYMRSDSEQMDETRQFFFYEPANALLLTLLLAGLFHHRRERFFIRQNELNDYWTDMRMQEAQEIVTMTNAINNMSSF